MPADTVSQRHQQEPASIRFDTHFRRSSCCLWASCLQSLRLCMGSGLESISRSVLGRGRTSTQPPLCNKRPCMHASAACAPFLKTEASFACVSRLIIDLNNARWRPQERGRHVPNSYLREQANQTRGLPPFRSHCWASWVGGWCPMHVQGSPVAL